MTSALASLNPLRLPPPSWEDEMVEDFLANPIDSRLDSSSRLPTDRDSLPSPVQRHRRKPLPSVYKVSFDWDSSVREITDRLIRDRPSSQNVGLPNIAKREIQQEKETRRKQRRIPVWTEQDIQDEPTIFPSRKNEIPNVRKDPGLLRFRRRHRFL